MVKHFLKKFLRCRPATTAGSILLALFIAMVLLTLILRHMVSKVPWTLILPAHFRSLVLISLCLWLWGLHVHLMESSVGISVSQLLGLQSHSNPSGSYSNLMEMNRISSSSGLESTAKDRSPSPNKDREFLSSFAQELSPTTPGLRSRHHRDMYQLAFICTFLVGLIIWIASWIPQSSSSGRPEASTPSPTSVESGLFHQVDIGAFTAFSFTLLTLLLFCPFDLFVRRERFRFLTTLVRISFSSFRSEVPFSDVILADILTSFSRVFGDVFVVWCTLIVINPTKSVDIDQKTSQPSTCTSSMLLPMVIGTPYLWRFRQCISEYLNHPQMNRLQLWNALKYFSIIPVLVSGFLLRLPDYTNSNWVQQFWIFFLVLNSAYSYWWDIRYDWDLGHWHSKYFLLRDRLVLRLPSISSLVQPLSSRKHSASEEDVSQRQQELQEDVVIGRNVYPLPTPAQPLLYYFALIVNLMARFAWAWRLLLIHWGLHLDAEFSVFALQLIEIVRRWMWLFFRLENRWLQESLHLSTLK